MNPILQPLIGLSADWKDSDGRPVHSIGDKYVRAILVGAQGLPLVIPALGAAIDPADLARRLDGLCLTGSLSNVHPRHYRGKAGPHAEPYDEARDEIVIPLIRQVLAQGVPLLAICRGFQELNVALGGSLHTQVHDLPGREDHRAPKSDDADIMYGPRHLVRFEPGGAFATIAGSTEVQVNSLHSQGIDRLADGITIEGTALDGTIEAVRVTDAPAFALGVQWHPEYKADKNPFSMKLYHAFGEACRARAKVRAGGKL
ncbi:MAG: gamma-glutamyl-gamma-aminobutyrate hydrolase family protein [Rhodospirillaceae bacterium]|nr:gamma-glutamyl-gamma-aminobutyrate hydrolase family protein [Rhodospirillaceae bacterium]